MPVLVVTAALMGSPTVTLDNWEGNKDSAQLSSSNKSCLKMPFWPPGMCCQATNDPSKGQASKGGVVASSGDFGSACEGGRSLLEMVLTAALGAGWDVNLQSSLGSAVLWRSYHTQRWQHQSPEPAVSKHPPAAGWSLCSSRGSHGALQAPALGAGPHVLRLPRETTAFQASFPRCHLGDQVQSCVCCFQN